MVPRNVLARILHWNLLTHLKSNYAKLKHPERHGKKNKRPTFAGQSCDKRGVYMKGICV
jgi:hypothetical protein